MEFANGGDFELKPDMWANVTIRPSLGRKSLAVPVQAVIRTGKRDIVLIALEGGRFAPREVRLGAEAGNEFEVLDGIAEGERVVTSAQFFIDSESNLRSAIGKMLEPKTPEGGGGRVPGRYPVLPSCGGTITREEWAASARDSSAAPVAKRSCREVAAARLIL